jgi:UDP-N-acetylglucosamine diphosphorylase / glucose-1-phosphate thymidylyltransferase / UDP-N-acetylgalactosamine diphosphorylase / glucosamine-1-phosphate N-acetyltransferase / galactosamine-1-phosphate N-acetyltransferase
LIKKAVIVFEDEYFSKLYPISLSRPTYEVLAGALTNIERIKHHFASFEIFTLCRPFLAGVFSSSLERKSEAFLTGQYNTIILINGGVVLRSTDLDIIEDLKKNDQSTVYLKGETIVAAILSLELFRDLYEDIKQIFYAGRSKAIINNMSKRVEVNTLILSYIWDPIRLNAELLESDFHDFFKDSSQSKIIGDSSIYCNSEIYADANVSADVASVIDARNGPVIISKGVKIKPFCYIEGPAFIGPDCWLVGGKVTSGCSFGGGCRIGGEVENSIIIGNTNKYHDGFIGHSYIGEWVNLGALTTNSDLANNYSDIKVKQNGRIINTKSNKVGCFIGDHSKTGIGMTLNTGITIGFSSNLFGGGWIAEREVPSFAWGNDSIRRSASLKRSIETAEIVLNRRGLNFEEKHQQMFAHIFSETSVHREGWRKKSNLFGK